MKSLRTFGAFVRVIMANSYPNGASAHTLTALNRWSVADKTLPAVDKIKTIHVYDFDNTRALPPSFTIETYNCVIVIVVVAFFRQMMKCAILDQRLTSPFHL